MGNVLITSRHEEVAQYANRGKPPHRLRFLKEDESLLLLQLDVFGKHECPPQLKDFVKLIAERCHGLPLAIKIIGGILVQIAEDEMSATTEAWKEVCESLGAYVNENAHTRVEKIIALSYDKLPHHLRACFLYLGIFPEDFEIPVWKLIRMWVAEGFIQQKAGLILEDTAVNYLGDLIKRNLVKTDKINPVGRVITCRIHDMVRDFCKGEAGSETENFLQEITKSADGTFNPPVDNLQKDRRLSIHSDVDTIDFISSKPFGPYVRSFVCFSKDEINLPPENMAAIPKAFKLLRVLDVQPIKFTKLPRNLYQLVHLNYIAVSLNIAVLPPAFSKLWNIQTLIVNTTSRTLEIRADIWKMTKLRHFKTNASATLPITESKKGEKLLTLSTVSPESCTEEVLKKAHNLRKLGIHGRLALLLDGKSASFDSLRKLDNLEKLKLQNGLFYTIQEGKLSGLPPYNTFPPNLSSLTLSDTFLDWHHMSIIGLLVNLKVLKLKDNAFEGERWVATDEGFCCLEVFFIRSTNLVVWEAEGNHFPKLRHLELRNCEELRELPIGLADISTLQLVELYRCTSATTSAKKILEAKLQKQEEQTATASIFNLSIFPPEELTPFI